jgi:hypothetical protein
MESNFQICKKCQQKKLRILVGKYPNGDNKYQDELGKPWNGKTCSRCYGDVQKARMRAKRGTKG